MTTRILTSAAELPSLPRGGVVSIGNFDGVHRAHQAVLASVIAAARSRGGPAVALTFEPHPVRLLRPASAPRLITPQAEKLRLLAATGLDAIVVLPFTRELSQLPPRRFVEQFIASGLRAAAVHEGGNFQFGHQHLGTVAALAELGREMGFEVVVHPEMSIRGQLVSSSGIRKLISAGDVSRAARLLGRWFSVRGGIVTGHGVGRRLTVPTLNLGPYPELLPARGVYVTETRLAGRWLRSVSNCGLRPTFSPPLATAGADDPLTVETHLLEFDAAAELPEEMEIRFLFRLREERKFPTPEALKRQILLDAAGARRFLRRLPQALGSRL